jgi:valyl-tRNA synthetase
VFGQLFEKNLVYRGYKVMPFSTALSTPLSNFEANQEMKEVTDPAGVCVCVCVLCMYLFCTMYVLNVCLYVLCLSVCMFVVFPST